MALAVEEYVKLIDVAKAVADRYSKPIPTSHDLQVLQDHTDTWTTTFDRAYKAIKATVERKKT